MNAVYPKFLEAALNGDGDVIGSNVKVALLTEDYTYDEAHEFLDDITGSHIVENSPNLASKTATAGVFEAADVTFASLTGNPVRGYAIYIDTGSAATSQLVAFYDTDDTQQPIEVDPDGSDFILRFSELGIFTI